MGRGLLLVGHGSGRNRHSGEAVHAQAERIRARGVVEEVGVGFLKEEPLLPEALAAMGTDVTDIVPLFASAGYYTEQVIPRALRLEGRETLQEERLIRYREPLGLHPGMADIIIDRARGSGADAGASLVVLGHGTPRHPHSAASIHTQAGRVRDRGVFGEVQVVFLDQEPHLEQVWDLTRFRRVILVPLLMAEGWHVRETIPEDLSLKGGRITRGPRFLQMTEAVGTHPGIADLIIDWIGRQDDGTPWPASW